MGLIFALVYHAIYLAEGETAYHGMKLYGRSEFVYFSFTTLTTIGYGDISPAVTSARSFSNMEGLIGQSVSCHFNSQACLFTDHCRE